MDGNAREIRVEEENGCRSVTDSEQLDGEEGPEKEELIGRIPEELIEGILSRVSYPYLYKARLLSRSWYGKFLIPPHELVGTSTNPFQREVMAAAAENWPKYGPVSVFGRMIVAYHRSLNCWHKLAIHERVPVDAYAPAVPFVSWRLAFSGSLMCSVGRSDGGPLQLLVANCLTGDWNLLPSPPEIRGEPIQDFRFLRVDSQHYKILVHNLPCPRFQAHLYESNQNRRTWTSLSNSGAAVSAGIPGLSPFSAYSDAYINGSLYCISKDSMGGMIIWKFNTDRGIWEQVLRSVEFDNEEVPGGMFQCGAKFMVVTLQQTTSPSPAAVNKQSCLAAKVYELHLQSLKLSKPSRSPPELVIGMQTATLVADAECIYFSDIPDQGPASFTSFNVNDHSWNHLPSPCPEYKWKWGRLSTFEPGLNPFAAP